MGSRSNTSRRRRGPTVALALALSVCALLLCACGSSKPSNTSKSVHYATDLEYSDCMRSHAVSNFPDPEPGGGWDISALGTSEMQSPAFVSAQSACQKLEFHGGPPPRPGFTEAQLQQMIAKARCIRQHGFPNLPDPDASGDNIGRGTAPAGWNPQAPAAITARNACARVGAVIPGWIVQWNGAATG